MENNEATKVLVIEDSTWTTNLIKKILSSEDNSHLFQLNHALNLAQAIEFLDKEPVDAIVLDLCLPDSAGFDTFSKIHQKAPKTPIVILTSLDDEALALKTIQKGAQEYLIKGQVEVNSLPRIIRTAIVRKEIENRA
jgi:DNA-binding NarL/FixJ family response regulator